VQNKKPRDLDQTGYPGGEILGRGPTKLPASNHGGGTNHGTSIFIVADLLA
jgi:hypothetical protein